MSSPVTDFDFALCGAGPVGLVLAGLLVKHGQTPARIALIDNKPAEQAGTDPRSIALSWGSRLILEDIGAWPAGVTRIDQIHISRRGRFGRTLIDRKDYDLPALGYVTRYGTLVETLTRAVEASGVTLIRPAQIVGSEERADSVALDLMQPVTTPLSGDGRRRITSAMLVRAEGGVFTDQNVQPLHRDYGQTAIVALVTADQPLANRAFERFTDEGPLALLPQDNAYAMVWCMQPARAQALNGLSDAAFLNELQEAFGFRLGRFTTITQRSAFPLGLNARPAVSARSVAIGNAAQTLHPVAGQGLNLGLRDAAVLARLLARDPTPEALRRYVYQRNTDRKMTIGLTDVMARIFVRAAHGLGANAKAGSADKGLADGMIQNLLGLSLGLIDVTPPVRRLLAEQMMFGRR